MQDTRTTSRSQNKAVESTVGQSPDGGRLASVLIVDDEPSIRFVLRVVLEASGHRVTEASHGRAALEVIAAERPDLVTTDFMMPIMNGGQLIAALRGDPATAAIPILLISSSPGAADVPGADAFMQKPLDPGDVVERVQSILDERS